MISMMMMHISLIIIIIALVAEEPGGLSVPGLSLMLQLLVSRDGKVTDDISRTYVYSRGVHIPKSQLLFSLRFVVFSSLL